jgi:hypothetical protein
MRLPGEFCFSRADAAKLPKKVLPEILMASPRDHIHCGELVYHFHQLAENSLFSLFRPILAYFYFIPTAI